MLANNGFVLDGRNVLTFRKDDLGLRTHFFTTFPKLASGRANIVPQRPHKQGGLQMFPQTFFVSATFG